ncbi:hypothetical protein PGT21_024190 [Puccinia graminis f. sp. tritici]|uniref:Uncharacterized protein n=1 Tax=Puccinia graminis f. sp. tritici TaxID=56615 RepID=A0A5B0PBD9_PUCGR|nr:hypothetical protein PGT21_024190 [Puccinia graminis f. sp. tritici]KAA1117108.1 hypothetical protein PGTUg99_035907 [Puccinia graminis f. sp. tritici]
MGPRTRTKVQYCMARNSSHPHCANSLLGLAIPTNPWTGLSEQLLDMVVQQEVGVRRNLLSEQIVPPSTARTSQLDDSLDGYVRELLAQAGPLTGRTGISKQLADTVPAGNYSTQTAKDKTKKKIDCMDGQHNNRKRDIKTEVQERSGK